MPEIKITPLTPVHIGSGKEMMANFEYLHFPKEGKVALVDNQKVLKLIGEDQVDQWVSIIDKGENLLDYLKQRKSDIQAADVALRSMKVRHEGIKGKNIKEFWHNGANKPIIPGSSLKGALRTAVFSNLAKHRGAKLQNKIPEPRSKNYKNKKWKDKCLQKAFFGNKPNQDIFRLLRVMDAHFEYTHVTKIKTLNLEGYPDNPQWKFKDGITHFGETLPDQVSAFSRIAFPRDLHKQAKGYLGSDPKHVFPEEVFKQANTITQEILEIEKSEMEKYSSDQFPNLAKNYFEFINNTLSDLEDIQDPAQTCIIRMGYGSGYRSITGDWLEDVFDYEQGDERAFQIFDFLRNKKYKGQPFPKSRTMTADGLPLGFVKLEMIE